jgi:hypothetical protein
VQIRIRVGVDPRIIGEEILHRIEAVVDRHGVDRVAQMPLSRKIGLVAVLPEKLCDGRRLRSDLVRIAGRDHHRKGGAYWDASGNERGAAGRAACLAVPLCKRRAAGRELVEDGRRRVAGLAAAKRAEIAPAGIVGHDDDDIGPLVLRLGARRQRCQDKRRGHSAETAPKSIAYRHAPSPNSLMNVPRGSVF